MKIGVFEVKINSISIEGISRIKEELQLKFNDGMNIICGINGTCKTTILECIAAHFFTGSIDFLKKNVASKVGRCNCVMTEEGEIKNSNYTIGSFDPTIRESRMAIYECSQLMYFKTNRVFNYSPLDAIPNDVKVTLLRAKEINRTGVPFDDFKGWFVHRYLFSHIPDSLTAEQKLNLMTAIECFSVLDKDISFSRVRSDSNDIMVNSKQGEIYFEYLSAGYKSCLYILMGIIKEIEFRVKRSKASFGIGLECLGAAKDFDGVILIDEVDLHLHPVWQTAIVRSLKEIFPQAQIIVTTHSPHIIQAAEPNEVIPLVIDENGNIRVKEVESREYGFQGWTVEEILEDVMGMENTRSELYINTIRAFDRALDKEDDAAALENYKILQKMLHPRSHLRKVLEIQMAGVEKGSD